jgi:hypothetical protein
MVSYLKILRYYRLDLRLVTRVSSASFLAKAAQRQQIEALILEGSYRHYQFVAELWLWHGHHSPSIVEADVCFPRFL